MALRRPPLELRRALCNKRVELNGDDSFRSAWTPILRAAGATLDTHGMRVLTGGKLDVTVVCDNPSEIVLDAARNHRPPVPVVGVDWVIGSVVPSGGLCFLLSPASRSSLQIVESLARCRDCDLTLERFAYNLSLIHI